MSPLPAGSFRRRLALPLVLGLMVTSAWPVLARAAEEGGGGHGGAVVPVLLALVVILVGAKVAGDVVSRLGQPAVLGELLFGILLGALPYAGIDSFRFIEDDVHVAVLAELGVVILLFEVGLESTVREMMRVGASSLLVAVLGVIAPFALGWGAGAVLLPDASVGVHAFLGASLTATSVGITARVLRDIGQSQSPEARVILGAAVVDDVLGLVILAVVAGAIQAADRGVDVEFVSVGLIVLKAAVFLVGSVILGAWAAPRWFGAAFRLRGTGVLLAAGLALAFLLAWLAAEMGLAPIVGAFAAGLILEGVHYRGFLDRGEHELEELVRPLSWFLVPIFFVHMGIGVDLGAFADVRVLGLAAALTLAAIAGKMACGLGILGGAARRLPVALGMVPRGEVGLIFAGIGRQLTLDGQPVIGTQEFSAVVVMVVLTTLVTPPALRWALGGAPPEPAAMGRNGA